MARRTAEQQIQDLQAKIAAIQERADRKKAKKNPAVKFMAMGLRSLDKALNSTDDAVLRKALDHARVTVASCLAMTGVKAGAARKVLGTRPRGGSGQKLDAAAILAYLKSNPGSSSESISKQFSTDAASLRSALRQLIDDGKVRTTGERRGTRYSADA